MKDNKEDEFDVDEYIKQIEEEDKKLLEEGKALISQSQKHFELNEEDRRLIELEKQIFSEREKEDKYVKTLSPEQQKEYLREKYEIADELAKLNKVKIVKLKSPDGKKE